MNIDADLLAKQVKLAYDFMETLHGQAIALIKDVETQLAQAPEELQCLRPGGYRFATSQLSYGLERPQPIMGGYYGVCFRHFAGRPKNTPFDERLVPPICFLKVVLREQGLQHPEARFGVMAGIAKPADRAGQHPRKFEDIVSDPVMSRALVGPPWCGRTPLTEDYKHAYIELTIHGVGARLAKFPDSEAIAERIVGPLLRLYREASDSASTHEG